MHARVRLLLVGLTLVAGYADAVAFFGLGVFTANMTGNTVLLGGAIVGHFLPNLHGDIGLVLPALSLAAFSSSAFAAALFLRNERGRPPVRTSAVLLSVATFLAVTAALQHWAPPTLVALAVAILSASMGAQSVVALRLGVSGISTTFVTGTLVRWMLDLVEIPRQAGEQRRIEGRTNGTIWAFYLGGAVAGAVGLKMLGADALWLPAVVVALLLVVV